MIINRQKRLHFGTNESKLSISNPAAILFPIHSSWWSFGLFVKKIKKKVPPARENVDLTSLAPKLRVHAKPSLSKRILCCRLISWKQSRFLPPPLKKTGIKKSVSANQAVRLTMDVWVFCSSAWKLIRQFSHLQALKTYNACKCSTGVLPWFAALQPDDHRAWEALRCKEPSWWVLRWTRAPLWHRLPRSKSSYEVLHRCRRREKIEELTSFLDLKNGTSSLKPVYSHDGGFKHLLRSRRPKLMYRKHSRLFSTDSFLPVCRRFAREKPPFNQEKLLLFILYKFSQMLEIHFWPCCPLLWS